jgi:DtxR family Mn-dependent transcriptional regulator
MKTKIKVTETIENYLESIYNMRDEGKQVIAARLSERLGVKPPTVSQTLRRMERDGLVKMNGNEIAFTKTGQEVAEAAIRRHRLVERFMTDFLGIGWAVAHTEAEKLQHAISDLIEQKMAEALGHPQACPHGNPIPGAQSTRLPPDALTLDATTAGQRVTILRITEEGERDPRLLDHLQKHRLVPGAVVTIDEVAPWSGVITLALADAKIPLGLKAARTIWVKPAGET